MNKTSIQWTNYTLQLVRFRSKATGRTLNWCQKISPGCRACYAERITRRFHGTQHSYTPAGRDLVEPYPDREALRELVTTRRRGMVFIEDMSDLFGDWVPDTWLDECFAAFAMSPLTIQVLTKRADRMRAYMTDPETPLRVLAQRVMMQADAAIIGERVAQPWPLPNVWLGVSAEDQQRADERIPHLLAAPAAVRFVSAEPLLGPIDLNRAAWGEGYPRPPLDIQARQIAPDGVGWRAGFAPLRAVDLVILGGESGPKARPCHVAWIRSLVAQCREAGTLPFVKQLGANAIDDTRMCTCLGTCRGRDRLGVGWGCAKEGGRLNLRDSHGGDLSEWPEDLRVRELPATIASSTAEDAQPHRRQSRRSAPAEANGAATVPLHRGRPRRSLGAA